MGKRGSQTLTSQEGKAGLGGAEGGSRPLIPSQPFHPYPYAGP